MQWNTIYNRDCVAVMNEMETGSVDLAFADPPFNIGYSYDVYRDALAEDEYLQWSRDWMGEVCRILKPTGAFWLAIGDEFAAELKVCATRELGLMCRSWVVWYYTFGVHCTKKFTRSHSHIFHFVKDPKQFVFNDEAVRVPSARQLIYNDKRANPKGRLPDDTWILRPQEIQGEFGFDKDTWHVSRVCGTHKERQGWHGCQMPESILERIILVSSNENDKVFDPFLGSGTTVAVAKKLRRQFSGCEISQDYWEQCKKRLSQTEPHFL